MQCSMTVVLPKGSSGLNAPMRRDWPAARRMAATWFTSGLEVSQRAEGVLSCHLLAPLIHEVSVIERACFHVCRFGGCLDLIFGERFSDQRTRCFFDLDRRGRDAAEHDARIFNVAVVGGDPRCYTQHWKIEGAATSQLLIRSAPAVCRRELDVDQQFVGTLAQVVDAVVVVESRCVDDSFTQRRG